MADFIGLAMSLINKFFEREIIVVDLSRMPGPHNAEFIIKAISDMIKKFKFDKNKLTSMF